MHSIEPYFWVLATFPHVSKTQAINKFYIPDILVKWPWRVHLNPAYKEQKALSSAWFRSFNAFDPSSQKAFDLCDFGLLAAYVYPHAEAAHLRSGCDLMNCFFLFDEYSDVAEPDVVRKQADVIMDAIRHPHIPRPKGEFIGGEAHRQFWELAKKGATPTAQRRFIEVYQAYVNSIIQQAIDRADNHIRDVNSYFQVRRDTIGVKPSFTLLEFTMDIPDEIMEHPVIHEFTMGCVDMLIIQNDIYSYNVEQAVGNDLHNLVTIVMNQYNLDVQGAIDWIGRYNDELADRVLENYRNLPDWGPVINPQIHRYCDSVGEWVRGIDSWYFHSWRYFRGKGPEIEKTRWVELMPKQVAAIIPSPAQSVLLHLKRGFLRSIALQPSLWHLAAASLLVPALGLYLMSTT
ncbi:terpenoid synthase [Rhodocollybia butyracea]|uniref:Terpene synthase n=1 Tax=Rhodocollybia butyracea TaxID=206335 RepID=A0A9P5Q2Z3_9AGAR|nr:terpenoid synthase [Rhodocollybia butyracea]